MYKRVPCILDKENTRLLLLYMKFTNIKINRLMKILPYLFYKDKFNKWYV